MFFVLNLHLTKVSETLAFLLYWSLLQVKGQYVEFSLLLRLAVEKQKEYFLFLVSLL